MQYRFTPWPGHSTQSHLVQNDYPPHQTRVIESYAEKDICQSRSYTTILIVHPIRKHFPLPDKRFKRCEKSESVMCLLRGVPYGFMRFMQEEDGISFIECALVASLVAVVVSIGLLALGKVM
jgi:hypothetical protein